MTNDEVEAEKMARALRPGDELPADWMLHNVTVGELRSFCDHILSGDMKREIENAAYRNARAILVGCDTISEADDKIYALIQPPAQKEDGE